MQLKIKIDKRAVDKVLSNLSPKNVASVLTKGLNASAREAKKISVESIGKTFFLQKRDINVSVRVRKATPYRQQSTMSVEPRPIGLEKFKPKQNAAGLSVKVLRSKGLEQIPSGFMQRIKGRTLPMVRTEAIRGATTNYVAYPSTKPRRGGLPINRLLADPVSNSLAPRADAIATAASDVGSAKVVSLVEELLDKGKA